MNLVFKQFSKKYLKILIQTKIKIFYKNPITLPLNLIDFCTKFTFLIVFKKI